MSGGEDTGLRALAKSAMEQRVARALCEAEGMNPNNWPHKAKAARAAIEAMDGWSADFSEAPHDTSLWVYATDDQGYAYGPAAIEAMPEPSEGSGFRRRLQVEEDAKKSMEQYVDYVAKVLRSSLTGDSK